jgi:hypothetical protein
LQCWRCHTGSYSGRRQPSLSFLDWIIIIFELSPPNCGRRLCRFAIGFVILPSV